MFCTPCTELFVEATERCGFDPASGKLSGEIVVDAKSGESGSGMRDRKMHKEILESERYPEITFRPDRIEGAVANQGKSSVKVHGMFSIHGVDREIMVPPEVDMVCFFVFFGSSARPFDYEALDFILLAEAEGHG
jgi:polyisoprenoid-binding protein YceI